ncbi:hypothetical protein SAY86_003212 [Trapa natans]|uniref:RING-type domain-containing protein n=1 Tax=Trapa natans TaxID=22666 RepID=A0AAN7MW98_TRANT|nr:hypothetical protein SAY86_003212 [Trapa natans]
MESIATKSCNVGIDTTSLVSADQSRNKRKFQIDTSPSNVTGIIPLPQNDSSIYEFSTDTFEMPPSQGQTLSSSFNPDRPKLDLGLPSRFEVRPGLSQQARGEIVDTKEVQEAAWSHPGETELEKLAMSSLDTIFKSAIRKVISLGYPEEIATKAVLMSGLCYGSKDLITTIVENTLAFMRSIEGLVDLTTPDHKHNHFRDLEALEKYVLAEMVYVLRGVCPFFSVGDAIWCLLLCDMNISCACTIDGEGFSGLNDERRLSRTAAYSQPKWNEDSRDSEVSLSGGSASSPMDLPSHLRQAEEQHSSSSYSFTAGLDVKDNSISLEAFKESVSSSHSQHSEKSMKNKKVLSSINKRGSLPRQKSLLLEKHYRKHGCKGSSKVGKLSPLSGSSVTDKELKHVLDSNSLKITEAVGVGEVAQEINSCISLINAGPSTVASLNLQTNIQTPELLKTNVGATPVQLTSSVSHTYSGTNTELSLSLAATSNTKQVTVGTKNDMPTDGITGALCGKSSVQSVAHDKKEAIILYLTPIAKELQNQIKGWNDWAVQKVTQATQRLTKDNAELKMLRQEKEEVERLKKEKQNLEESTLKKLAEMENAICSARGQVARANSAVRRLELENATMRREMEVAELHALESAANLEEALKREESTRAKFQSWEKQKVLIQEEVAIEKAKLGELLQEVEMAKNHKKQTEASCRQEEKAKEDLIAQATQIRKEREQLEASTKSKESVIKLEANSTFLRCKEDIQKLEEEISKLRLKTDSSKIAALRDGIVNGTYARRVTDGKASHVHEDGSSATTGSTTSKLILDFKDSYCMKRERECVMCLSEETCVVFVPCAHQVVCRTCNELHEKQGMKDCPSCRSTIQRRIAIRYAPS